MFSIRVTWRVRRGEELTISYLDSLDEGGPCTTQDRHRYLKWGYRYIYSVLYHEEGGKEDSAFPVKC